MIDLDAARQLWHPVAASDDLPLRHVFHAQLFGRELALWRADDGHVNAWENRCLHRGVRLSIGVNDGTELVCQYHGWRYANRTAGCTYIPAHPADAPARTICNNTYPVFEKNGLVWCCELDDPNAGLINKQPANNESKPVNATPLYALSVNGSLAQTADGFINALPPLTQTDGSTVVITLTHTDNFTLTATKLPDGIDDCRFYLQPADAGRTIVRGVLSTHSNFESSETMHWVKQFAHALNHCRRHIENLASQQPAPDAWHPVIKPVSEKLVSMPNPSMSSEQSELRLQVARIDTVANGIKCFRLESIDGQLPSAQPGAHIDVHLPNGFIRQYSLINGPGQTDHYAIAVKRLADSTGGSLALHTLVKTGDVVAASPPRNNFSLRRDAQHTYLIAGGIGITPLLSMARSLHHAGLPFSLDYFVTSTNDIVFRQELESMTSTVRFHSGLSVTQTQSALDQLLSTPDAHHHVYLCGPTGMLSAARKVAAAHGWPDSHVHFEYFKNTTNRHTSSPFTVELARSGLTLNVPDGKTLLQVLREHTVAVPSSCEQGACGTCRVSVLDGIPDHQDVYLNDAEKERGDCLMSCVSRAKSDSLILDL